MVCTKYTHAVIHLKTHMLIRQYANTHSELNRIVSEKLAGKMDEYRSTALCALATRILGGCCGS